MLLLIPNRRSWDMSGKKNPPRILRSDFLIQVMREIMLRSQPVPSKHTLSATVWLLVFRWRDDAVAA